MQQILNDIIMVEIDKKLYQEIKDYCKLNNLVIKDFVNKLLRKALTVEKYGDKPFSHENGTIVDNKKKENRVMPEVTPEAIWVPYVPEEVVTTVVNSEPLNVELPEKIKERYFGKPVDEKFYGKIQVDGLLEKESNGKIGKMELPDEPPYKNVMVTTEHVNNLETQAIEKIKDLVENQVSVPAEIMEIVDEHFFDMLGDEKPVKTEEPKVVKKSRKRKLN